MKQAPSLYKLDDILHPRKNVSILSNMVDIDGKWLPARPLGFYSLQSRIKLAWMVFTGKADVLVWPGGQ